MYELVDMDSTTICGLSAYKAVLLDDVPVGFVTVRELTRDHGQTLIGPAYSLHKQTLPIVEFWYILTFIPFNRDEQKLSVISRHHIDYGYAVKAAVVEQIIEDSCDDLLFYLEERND